jgi:hypothetical protein
VCRLFQRNRWPLLIRWSLNGVLLLVGLLLVGCVSPVNAQRASVKAQPPGKEIAHNEPKVAVHTVQKWNPVWWFGNADDPEPPDWYKPEDPARHRKWHLRNPLHNFTFYVVGVADKPFERVGRHPQEVFNPAGGWNWATCRYKYCRLPFFSYTRGRFVTYWGWRERGNFGVKLTFRRKQANPIAKAGAEADG